MADKLPQIAPSLPHTLDNLLLIHTLNSSLNMVSIILLKNTHLMHNLNISHLSELSPPNKKHILHHLYTQNNGTSNNSNTLPPESMFPLHRKYTTLQKVILWNIVHMYHRKSIFSNPLLRTTGIVHPLHTSSIGIACNRFQFG